MPQDNIIAVLVAEKSVLDFIDKTIDGLLRKSNVKKIYIIVPHSDMDSFEMKMHSKPVYVVCENELINTENQERIKQLLRHKNHRYGWYLQQFLKLEFINYIDEEDYLIWDADTILLKKTIFDRSRFEVSPSLENHTPYFRTLKKLTGIEKQVNFSFVMQYMMVNKSDLCSFFSLIDHKDPRNWYFRVLECLELDDESEFSEYESFGNFVAFHSDKKIMITSEKWFRYGAAIYDPEKLKNIEYEYLEKKFSGYTYVAFERHSYSLLKRIASRIMAFLRL